MKAALIVCTALVIGSATASAQDTSTGGVKGGVNATSSFTEDPLVDTSFRPGFVVGAFGWFKANDRVSIQPEFLYSQKRTKFTVEGMDATVTADYIEFPVLLDVRLNSSPSRVSLIVGPSLSFRARARLESQGVSIDAEDQLDTVDFSIVTGLAFTAGRFVLDGRYTWGLVDVAREEGLTGRLHGFAITAGWRFR